jgi:hypothetical protein
MFLIHSGDCFHVAGRAYGDERRVSSPIHLHGEAGCTCDSKFETRAILSILKSPYRRRFPVDALQPPVSSADGRERPRRLHADLASVEIGHCQGELGDHRSEDAYDQRPYSESVSNFRHCSAFPKTSVHGPLDRLRFRGRREPEAFLSVLRLQARPRWGVNRVVTMARSQPRR